MEDERSLLQQIREKEQEFAAKIEAVKQETNRAVAAAREEAEARLCTAEAAGKADAERIYWGGKAAIEAETESLKQRARTEREAAARAGEANQPRAVDAITGSVMME
jgi:vacuolar-type H+-ATPase subunit H